MSENTSPKAQLHRSPFCRQFIAITPRSGSTWWCDLLARAGAGKPAEYLNEAGIWRKSHPLYPDLSRWAEFHSGMARSAGCEAYDLKASWFQFEPVLNKPLRRTLATDGFPDTVWTYLTRRDLPAQALSLYLMKRLRSAHTRKGHAPLEFDAAWFEVSEKNLVGIMCWLLHVAQQEYGWQIFFTEHGITPWCCTYEEIAQRPISSVWRYLQHLIDRDTHLSRSIPNPRGAARRAVRLSRLVKRAYPSEQTEALLGAFRDRFSRELIVLEEHRGKESAATLRRATSLLKLDQSELANL